MDTLELPLCSLFLCAPELIFLRPCLGKRSALQSELFILHCLLQLPNARTEGRHLRFCCSWSLLGCQPLDSHEPLKLGKGCDLCSQSLRSLRYSCSIHGATLLNSMCSVQRGRHIDLDSGYLHRCVLDALLPLVAACCASRRRSFILIFFFLGCCLPCLLVQSTLLCSAHDQQLLLHFTIPRNRPTTLGWHHTRLSVARPHLRAAHLVAKPPSTESRTITFIPKVQVHIDVLVSWNLL
mmetsp:Transcript_64796/g.171494  ORF Transcript_64796/g.171494 Transcript_64796/m.171494 type:complete len:238 (-) Transcript_64796:384-1097(-)